jgi:hypothetical protein
MTNAFREATAFWRKPPDLRCEERFIRHNQRMWHNYASSAGEGEILLEQFPFPTAIIAQSYFVNLTAKRFNARIRAYWPHFNSRFPREPVQKIYESFNAELFAVRLLGAQALESDRMLREVIGRIKTKRDVEELRLDGVLVGDLLYDSHLMKNHVPTVEIGSSPFQESLKNALDYYVFWRDYLDSHHVKAVIVSHCVYSEYAIVLRLAIDRGIPCYQVNATHIYRLSEKNLWAYTEFRYYPEEFRSLSLEEQNWALALAKERIEKRLNGEIGVDMRYSKKSAYARTERKRIVSQSNRTKVLIATHCFFDSPHGYGIHLFPDFYEWLDFLGKISEKKNYDWYIKTHPDYLPGTMEIVKSFIDKYPKWNLLPAEASHLQLIEDGLDCVLTVYGTIGFEYAALGKLAVNASPCNPYVRYNFNMNPLTVEAYEEVMMNLPGQKLRINLQEVYEYYYLRFVDNVDNWLYPDFDRFIREVGGFQGQSGPISYTRFLEGLSDERHQGIIKALDDFICSGDFNLKKKHLAISKGCDLGT